MKFTVGVKTKRHPAEQDTKTIQQRFEEFDKKFPDVLEYLIAASRYMKEKGQRGSIALLWERMRQKAKREGLESEGYRFPNDFRSRYARKIMEICPDLAGFFEIRSLFEKEK